MSEDPGHIDFELIARYLNREASEEEVRLLREWLDSSAENRDVFASLKLNWVESAKEHFTRQEALVFDTDVAWANVSNRLFKEEKPKQARVYRIAGQPLWRVAAVFVLVIGAVFWFRNSIDAPPALTVIENSLLDSAEEHSLPDSSTIVVTPGSKLELEEGFGQDHRSLALSGEAYFQVQPDTTVPFKITTQNVDIEVVGTSFNVDASSADSTVVYVESGIVRLEIEGSTLELHAGETGVSITSENKLIKRGATSVRKYWKGILLDFRGKKLGQVFNSLEHMYGSRFNVSLELLNKRIHVKFQNEELDTMLDIISMTLDLDIVERDGIIEVRSLDEN